MSAEYVKATLEKVGLLGLAFQMRTALRTVRLRHRMPGLKLSDVDGLPLPPAELLVAIGGDTTPDAYLHGGIAIAKEIDSILTGRGISLAQFGDVLDFGCGCGRIIRCFKDLARSANYVGTDYNHGLVAWSREHLPFARFDQNGLAPPLPYDNAAFDFVYAFSVFTHFSEDLQHGWLGELRRVLKPGGHLLFTVHPHSSRAILSDAERHKYDSGTLVVRYASVAGTNLAAAFHPPQFIEAMAKDWVVADIRESAVGQRFVLLQNSPSAGFGASREE